MNLMSMYNILFLNLHNMKFRFFQDNSLSRQFNNLFLSHNIWLIYLFNLNNFADNLYKFFTFYFLNIYLNNRLFVEYWLIYYYLDRLLDLNWNFYSLWHSYNILNVYYSVNYSFIINLNWFLNNFLDTFLYKNFRVRFWFYFNNCSDFLNNLSIDSFIGFLNH